MIKKIARITQNISLLYKIYLLLFFVIIPLIVVSQLNLLKVSRDYRELLYQNVTAQLQNSGHEISQDLKTIEDISQMIMSDDNVQEGLSSLNTVTDSQLIAGIHNELRSLLGEYQENFRRYHISFIDLYSGSFHISSNSYESQKVPAYVHNEIRTSAEQAGGRSTYNNDHSDAYGLFLGKEIRQIENLSLLPLGELIIHIDIDRMISDATTFSNQYASSAYILINQGAIFYHSDLFTQEQARFIQTSVSDSYQVLKIDGNSYFAVRSGIPDYDWDYICLIDFNRIEQAAFYTRVLSFSTLTVCCAVMLFLASRLIHSLVGHLNVLKDKMLLVEKDITSVPEPDSTYCGRKDEIGVLHRQFDSTVIRLKHLIQVNYVNELLKKEAQIKALESQINPHFLYNTLESINWRAKALGAGDISEMVQSLAALLRVTLKKRPTEFKLYQEAEIINHYITIQKYRFEERLIYSADIPEELYTTIIPRLTLQPLVENAIQYGLEKDIDDCEILVTASVRDRSLILCVRNTGSHFEDDLMQKLESETIKTNGNGIGILNIYKRIQLTFGEGSGIRFYNSGEYAVAEITIPYDPDKVR